MSSYAYLCRKAGLPSPSGLAKIEKPVRAPSRRRKLKESEEKEILRRALDKMVDAGMIARTPDGKYHLP